jgi:hypothetical protein
MARNKLGGSPPDWKQFELAVARFVQAFCGDAKVTHDVQIPDAHTGYPRQRDVWVEWPLGGHSLVKALISCKYWNRALNAQDIDHFNGEFISSKANIGIIYARASFNDHALEKARALDFHCCKLYRDEAPDVPQLLSFGLAYHFRPQCRLSVRGPAALCGFTYWKDVLALSVGASSILDLLAREFEVFQHCKDPVTRWAMTRNGHKFVVQICGSKATPVEVIFECRYQGFQARLEYTMVNGSYNLTQGMFLGSESTPWISMCSPDPGPGWRQIDTLPEVLPSRAVAIYAQSDSLSHLRQLGETLVS